MLSHRIEIACRILGALLGAAGVLGSIWYFTTAPVSAIAPPALLLALSALPPDRIAKHPWLVLLGLAASVVDLVQRGVPLFRDYKEVDVEIYELAQWLLIGYFVIGLVARRVRDPVSWMRTLFPH